MNSLQRHIPTVTFFVSAASLCFARFRSGLSPLAAYDDDFFYYLRAAINFSHTGRSTFDGIHLTNGYHPLWFVLIAGLVRVFPPPRFFVALQTVEFLLASGTFLLLRRIFRTCTGQRFLADSVAVFVSIFAAALARGGMEIGLFFPLISGALMFRLRSNFSWDKRSAVLYGFLLSLVVLSRLDSFLLVILLLVTELRFDSFQSQTKAASVASFLGGGLLLPVYLFSNQFWFHVWMPISGQAKQLRWHHWPALRPFASVFLRPSLPLQILIITSITLTLLSIAFSRHKCEPKDRRRYAEAILCFPFVHLLTLSILSDWDVWPWYYYPFVLSVAAAAMLLLPQLEHGTVRHVQWLCWPALGAALTLGLVTAQPSSTAKRAYQENLQLAAYIYQHPGVYAMGDDSGMLSYLSSSPIVQTEGLMEDERFLQLIRQGGLLSHALRTYGATYYITGETIHSAPCFAVDEPAQAGLDSPRLHGSVCNRDALFHGNLPLHQIYLSSSVF